MSVPGSGVQRIAFFGGSFDPPHLGHIGIAQVAQAALRLDTVLFAPVGSQPLKPLGSTASFEDRVAMTELAIRGLPNFAISLVDAPDPSGEPNYTIDTLHRLQAQFPSAQLFTLIGADSFLSLRRWYRADEIPFVAPLIVASRPGQAVEDFATILPPGIMIHEKNPSRDDGAPVEEFTLRNASGAETPLYLLPGLNIEISATEFRENAGAGLDRLCGRHDQVPDTVCDYIAAHGLYQSLH